MTKTLTVTGMMCTHCEARAKKALEALPEVDSAEASAAKKQIVVTLNADIADDVLKDTIAKAGYEMTAVK